MLFTFPSRYWCTIGRAVYLALGGGPPRFPRPSTWTAVLRSRPADRRLSPTGLSPPAAGLSRPLRLASGFVQLRGGSPGPPGLASNPHAATAGALARHGFGLLPVRSPLLREYSLFLGVLRCFSSPGAPRLAMCSPAGDQPTAGRVPPFGHPRFSAWQRLPEALRGLPTSFIGTARHRHPPHARVRVPQPAPHRSRPLLDLIRSPTTSRRRDTHRTLRPSLVHVLRPAPAAEKNVAFFAPARAFRRASYRQPHKYTILTRLPATGQHPHLSHRSVHRQLNGRGAAPHRGADLGVSVALPRRRIPAPSPARLGTADIRRTASPCRR